MRRLPILAFLLLALFVVTPARADVNCSQHTFTNEDDTAHSAELPFSLRLGDTDYDQVFITTNGTLTFGTPDANYSTYPNTPSVSVAGWDWVTWGDGAYLSYGSTDTTFCAEWSVRQFPNSTGDLTQIRLMLTRASAGGWHGEVVTFGWLPNDLRRGIRFQPNTDVVTMEAAFDVNGGVPVEVSPAPVPSSFTEAPVEPTPTPTVEPTPEPTPSDTPTPEPTPTIEPTPTETPTVAPTAMPSPSESPTPTETPSPSESPTVAPTSSESPSATETPTLSPTPSDTPTATVSPIVAPNPTPEATVLPVASPTPSPQPVVLPPAIQIQLPKLLAKIPGLQSLAHAAEAFMAIGNDMTPKQRKKAQQVVVAGIIVNQLAHRRRK